MTAVNISIFYQQRVSDREISLAYAKEAVVSGMPFEEFIPAVQNILHSALQVAEAWGLDKNAFWDEAANVRQNKKA